MSASKGAPSLATSSRREWATWFARWIGVNVLAAISFGLLVGSSADAAGYVVGAVAIVLMFVPLRFDLLERFALAQAVLAAGVLTAYARNDPDGPTWLLVVTCALVIGTVALEPILRTLATVPPPAVANLPGLDPHPLPRLGVEAILVADALLVVVAALFDRAGWPVLGLFLIVLVLDLVTVALLLDRLRLRARRQRESREAPKKLAAFGPKFAVYFSGPAGSEYQLLMWLPHLERIGEPFVVILRESTAFRIFAAATTNPVVVRSAIGDVDTIVVPSLKAMIYVNNSAKNTHSVRFSELTHIQLLHGDSDKPPSFSPVTAMYDKIFVAGQAGIDRYARKGVQIPDEKFDIVGRPQVALVAPAAGHVSSVESKTVLYAPTWTGYYGDTDYCSLHLSEPIVKGLLDRGATVILRHHPYSLRNPASSASIAKLGALLAEDKRRTGRAHRWGAEVQDGTTLFDCFNDADALVGDVSSVVSDFLYSTKPFALVAVAGSGPEFVEEFPLASAAYVIESDLTNLDASLDAMLGDDPMADVRRETRNYYLGEIDADHYADTFVDAVRRYL